MWKRTFPRKILAPSTQTARGDTRGDACKSEVIIERYRMSTVGIKFISGFKSLRSLGVIQDTEETEKFCLMFDRFFDMMNSRAIDEGLRRRKPDLKAYECLEDSRFQVCR